MSMFSIHSPGGSEIEITDTIPDTVDVIRIPGARTIFAYGNAGKFSFQQVPFKGGSWWYSNYQPNYKIELRGSSDLEILEMFSAVRNHFVSDWDGIGLPSEKENQMGFAYTPWVDNRAFLEAGVIYETMDLHPELPWVIQTCGGVSRKLDAFLNSIHKNKKKKAARIQGNFKMTPSMNFLIRNIWKPDCHPSHHSRALELKSELFLLKALSQIDPPRLFSEPNSNNKAEQIEHILRERLDDPPNIADLATLVTSNVQTVQQIFKARFGMTIDDYSRMLRLERAEGFLLDTSKNLHAIAAETGYNDASALSRAFKRLYHCTPGDFRKSGGKSAKKRNK